jgi:hypothetical protein
MQPQGAQTADHNGLFAVFWSTRERAIEVVNDIETFNDVLLFENAFVCKRIRIVARERTFRCDRGRPTAPVR